MTFPVFNENRAQTYTSKRTRLRALDMDRRQQIVSCTNTAMHWKSVHELQKQKTHQDVYVIVGEDGARDEANVYNSERDKTRQMRI